MADRPDLWPYPIPAQDGGYSIHQDGSRTYSWGTRCEDCNYGFSADDPKQAQTMWWEHVRDRHPSAWSVLKNEAPALSVASDYHYPKGAVT